VALSADFASIGALGATVSDRPFAGAVHVYELTDSTLATAVLQDPTPATNSFFGAVLSASGSRVAVGHTRGSGREVKGEVHLFEIIPPNGVARSISKAGAVTIEFFARPGINYDVQRAVAANGPWTHVATQTASANGQVIFTDNDPPSPNAYYRLRHGW
jgi:hypothetical protein